MITEREMGAFIIGLIVCAIVACYMHKIKIKKMKEEERIRMARASYTDHS